MQMIGQNDNGFNGKRMLLFDCVEGLTKQLYGFGMVEEVLTVVGDAGEEVSCSGCLGTAVVHINGRLIRAIRIDEWWRNRASVG